MFGERGACAILGVMRVPKDSIGRWAGTGITVFLLSLSGCQPASETVPDRLIGAWHTSAPQYAGSTMEVTKDLVVFSREGGLRLSGRIVRFETVQERSQNYYRLTYRDDDRHDYHLLLFYDDVNGGTLTFKHQPALTWKRTGASL